MTTGLMARDTGDPIDFDKLRRDRFQRVLDSMQRHNLDVLIVGKPYHVRYVTSSNTNTNIAGARGFSPAVTVIRERKESHQMAWWDAGIPKEMPRERIYPTSWNPMKIMDGIKNAIGSTPVKRIGVDLMSPAMAMLLSQTFPKAALVDGEKAMLEARAIKTPEELDCLRTAIDISEGALTLTIPALKPGVTEQNLLGAFKKSATTYGVTFPLVQGGFSVQPTKGDPQNPPLRLIPSDHPVKAGELVVMASGFSYMAYDADIGRTFVCGKSPTPRQKALFLRWRAACDAMLEQCRPDRTASDINKAFSKLERITPPMAIAHGSGMGIEPPIIGTDLGAVVEQTWQLKPGMVLTLQPYVWQSGVGGILAKETVLITFDGYEKLTHLSHGPLEE